MAPISYTMEDMKSNRFTILLKLFLASSLSESVGDNVRVRSPKLALDVWISCSEIKMFYYKLKFIHN